MDEKIRGKCILCAEDNEVNRLVLEHTLNNQHLPYRIVNDGLQAVEAWRVLDPLVIFMDVSMPVMNGLEAISIIRKEEQNTGRRVPIVVFTAHAMNGDEKKMLEAGGDYYLTKPVAPDMLLAKLSEVLGKGEQGIASR